MNLKEPYLRINFILVVIIVLIFTYCFFLPQLSDYNATIRSACEGMPQVYCRSRGLTRAFHQILYLNFPAAVQLNKYSTTLFTFFAIQLLARIILSLVYEKNKKSELITIDAFISAAYFIYTFLPLTFIYYYLFEK